MSTFNRNTLVKVLEILDSSHAQEALAAAKLASAMVREAGLTWDQVIDDSVLPRVTAPSPTQEPAQPRVPGAGPFGYRRERELSPHEQFFMVLLSPRTPVDIKRKLRAWEGRVLDGEITPQESADLQFMYQSFVVG